MVGIHTLLDTMPYAYHVYIAPSYASQLDRWCGSSLDHVGVQLGIVCILAFLRSQKPSQPEPFRYGRAFGNGREGTPDLFFSYGVVCGWFICCLMIVFLRWNSYKYTQGDRFLLGFQMEPERTCLVWENHLYMIRISVSTMNIAYARPFLRELYLMYLISGQQLFKETSAWSLLSQKGGSRRNFWGIFPSTLGREHVPFKILYNLCLAKPYIWMIKSVNSSEQLPPGFWIIFSGRWSQPKPLFEIFLLLE